MIAGTGRNRRVLLQTSVIAFFNDTDLEVELILAQPHQQTPGFRKRSRPKRYYSPHSDSHTVGDYTWS